MCTGKFLDMHKVLIPATLGVVGNEGFFFHLSFPSYFHWACVTFVKVTGNKRYYFKNTKICDPQGGEWHAFGTLSSPRRCQSSPACNDVSTTRIQPHLGASQCDKCQVNLYCQIFTEVNFLFPNTFFFKWRSN